MAITKMASYDLKGNKLSFAGWISNLSPTETPFASMIGKESVTQTKYQWQTDVVPAVRVNAAKEGSVPAFDETFSTAVITNNTQIFRRTASVSDTANVVAFYGRGKELGYQMEKAGNELKRDIELAFLTNAGATELENAGGDVGTSASSGTAGKTAGFPGLVAKLDHVDADTGAKVRKKSGNAGTFTEDNLFDLTYNLYLANSKANTIMYHPKHAPFFSSLMELTDSASDQAKGNRMKMFAGMDDTYNAEVDTIIDPLGQRFALVPNRLMPDDAIYIFNPSDWTQMVLRAPKKIQLAKVGSSEEWMIEAELGLRHRNPFASGILELKA